MKLLYCPKCGDIFKLTDKKWRMCECGRARGRYMDSRNAVYSGGVPLGFNNFNFFPAINGQPERGLGRRFEAFVIPKECPTMREIKENGPEFADGPWAEGWTKRSGQVPEDICVDELGEQK